MCDGNHLEVELVQEDSSMVICTITAQKFEIDFRCEQIHIFHCTCQGDSKGNTADCNVETVVGKPGKLELKKGGICQEDFKGCKKPISGIRIRASKKGDDINRQWEPSLKVEGNRCEMPLLNVNHTMDETGKHRKFFEPVFGKKCQKELFVKFKDTPSKNEAGKESTN